MIKGTYTKTKIKNGLIFKKIKPNSKAEKIIWNKLIENVDVNQYIKDISNYINIPSVCVYEKSQVKQSFIFGLNIDEYLMKIDIKNDRVLKVFEELVKIYKNIRTNNTLTIDFNLMNFIVDKDDKIIYIDVTPPLYLKNIKTLDDRFKSQRELFLNKPLQLISFVMYFIMPFILKKNLKSQIKILFKKMLDIMKKLDVIADFSKKYDHIFYKRKELFLEYLNRNIDNFDKKFVSFDIKNDLNLVE